jgi:hypothetical protein
MTKENALSDCALGNMKICKSLTQEQLSKKIKLSCGCKNVSLGELITPCYQCDCGEGYYYSFCMKEVVESNDFWHCKDCGTCRESSEWHCKKCNDCTYGLTLPCDRCGKKSPYMP